MSRRSGASRRQPAQSALADGAKQRSYSAEYKYTALAAVKINGGNIHRTAIAFEIPPSTLRDWVDEAEREEREFAENPHGFKLKEKLGDLAAKLEDKVHMVVESITPDVIRKSTLSQRGVFVGIGIDKIPRLRGQGLEADATSELCRLLGINQQQLPENLELAPGQSIPAGYLQPVIDLQPNADGSFGTTCADCNDTRELKTFTGKSIPCPFCAPATSAEPALTTIEPVMLRCNACQFETARVPADSNPQPCPACHSGILSRVETPDDSKLLEDLKDDEPEN